MVTDIHLLLTNYGPLAFGVSSPQVPALVAGFDRQPDSIEEVLSLLRSAGAPDAFDLVVHRQEYHEQGGREWFVRIYQDPRDSGGIRLRTLRELEAVLQATPAPVDFTAKSPTGEAIFVIVKGDDRLGWLDDQMWPGDAVTLVLEEGDGLVMLPVVSEATKSKTDRPTARRAMTVQDLRDSTQLELLDAPDQQFLTGDALGHIKGARTVELISA